MNRYLTYIKKYWLILALLILFLSSFLFTELTSDIVVDDLDIDKTPVVIEEEILKTIKIDIKGFVTNPGLYELEVGSRVDDAIRKAGGLLAKSDTSTINLSKILDDQMVVIIYSKDEIKSMVEGNTTIKYIDKECVCPVVTNDACIEEVITNLPSDELVDTRISINTATATLLDQLPGIGLSKAQDIVNYRETNGQFKTIDDIMNVSGIGDSIFENIKDLIKI
jgi:competence protein ComEA